MAYSEDQYVTGRKTHMCLWCGQRICKGERHVVESVVAGNQHWRNRYHTDCRDAIGRMDRDELDWWNDEGCVPKYHRGGIELAT
jgi:hypothetical protein